MRCLTYIFMTLVLILATGCGHDYVEKESIHTCSEYEVYNDSIVRGEKIHTALSPTEITGAWRMPDTAKVTPVYSSPQMMADAIFTKAMSEPPAFTPLEIYLSLGMLRPEESIKALREIANRPIPDNEDFPCSTLTPYWALAAWETYCATGSKQWLKEAYNLLGKMLSRQRKLTPSQLQGFMCGMPQGVTDPASFYPEWMDDMARFETIATSVNITRANSLSIASMMAAELRLYAERELHTEASRLRNLINDRLWFPDLQRYSQYLYGSFYPIVSPVSDNEANALAILTDIATPEMSEAIVASLPYSPSGIPSTVPAFRPDTPLTPELQALFAVSAAKVRNPLAFTLASASLWNLSVSTPAPALWPAAVLKGMFGISLSPAGMTFSPMVPTAFPGEKRIKGLRYRNATLDVNILGTGDRVASFKLDSVSIDNHSVGTDISGHHTVTITLSGNDLNCKPLKIEETKIIPALPAVNWSSPFDFTITNFDRRLRYGVYINGVMEEAISSDHYSVRQTGLTVTDIVPMLSADCAGYTPKPHVYIPPANLITIPASSITPRRPPRHFIKDPATATNYIELAARHNTRITCYANVPDEGDYLITIGYSNGTDRCALRTLDVNNRYAATLLFPPRKALDWISVYPSTTAEIHLKAGVNKLALTYIQGTILFNRLTLIKR